MAWRDYPTHGHPTASAANRFSWGTTGDTVTVRDEPIVAAVLPWPPELHPLGAAAFIHARRRAQNIIEFSK